MNPNFSVEYETRTDRTGAIDNVMILKYKSVAIAIFHGDPSSFFGQLNDYLVTYGYLAEWRMRWNLGECPSWDESMRVNINS